MFSVAAESRWVSRGKKIGAAQTFLQRQPKSSQGTDDGPEVTPSAF
jgi:hypothetical protein